MADIKNTYGTNLVSHWKLDETSGTREDAHGSNDLTDNNTVGYGTGKQGNCADFEENDSEYLSRASASMSGATFTDSAWSINMWIYPETVTNNGLFAKFSGSSGYSGMMCGFNTNWIQCFADPNNSDRDINFNGGTTFANGEWAMVTITFESTYCRLYKNGSLAHTVYGLPAGALSSNSIPFVLGATYWTSVQNHWDGLIDEVSYWSRKLSDAEVTAIYNSGNGLPYEGVASGPVYLKTFNTITKANTKTIDTIAIASTKTVNTIA